MSQPLQLNVSLTLEEVNACLTALGKSLTYIEAAPLIEKIKEQVVPQLPVPKPQEAKIES
jgi:hypothetical protein